MLAALMCNVFLLVVATEDAENIGAENKNPQAPPRHKRNKTDADADATENPGHAHPFTPQATPLLSKVA